MRVESNASIYDDADKRCVIHIKSGVGFKGIAYLVLVSCYDNRTGAVNWYFGMTDQHLHDYPEIEKIKIIKKIMEQGGDVWKLQDTLNQTADYIEGLFNDR